MATQRINMEMDTSPAGPSIPYRYRTSMSTSAPTRAHRRRHDAGQTPSQKHAQWTSHAGPPVTNPGPTNTTPGGPQSATSHRARAPPSRLESNALWVAVAARPCARASVPRKDVDGKTLPIGKKIREGKGTMHTSIAFNAVRSRRARGCRFGPVVVGIGMDGYGRKGEPDGEAERSCGNGCLVSVRSAAPTSGTPCAPVWSGDQLEPRNPSQ
ncbi:hypothetical protein K438DRAFT_1945338 [Mycena galopus ATCC 62051]|nr:hypothetical protein K438DRAFT_1945338 [Mycena galopus ATCC 62051]